MKKHIIVTLSAIFLNSCSTNSNNDSHFQTLSPPNWLIGSVLDVGCGAGTHSYNETNLNDWNWKWIKEKINKMTGTATPAFWAERLFFCRIYEAITFVFASKTAEEAIVNLNPRINTKGQ